MEKVNYLYGMLLKINILIIIGKHIEKTQELESEHFDYLYTHI